ncbi:hypothetical protein RCL1_007415 [Eukaryota sp. TZLM3-RCL]
MHLDGLSSDVSLIKSQMESNSQSDLLADITSAFSKRILELQIEDILRFTTQLRCSNFVDTEVQLVNSTIIDVHLLSIMLINKRSRNVRSHPLGFNAKYDDNDVLREQLSHQFTHGSDERISVEKFIQLLSQNSASINTCRSKKRISNK